MYEEYVLYLCWHAWLQCVLRMAWHGTASCPELDVRRSRCADSAWLSLWENALRVV